MMLLAFMCLNCQCKHETETKLAVYFEENESQIGMLRGWDIYFEAEREYWSCKHWYNQDSLLAAVFVQVDKHNRVSSFDIITLCNDSITTIQTVIQNINMLYKIMHILGYKSIGAHEVELFNDTLAYDFCISMADDETTFLIMHMKSYIDTTDKQLYEKWYFKRIFRTPFLNIFDKTIREDLCTWDTAHITLSYPEDKQWPNLL